MRTQQVKGRKREVKMARDRGARTHPNSGAGSIKDDASSDTERFEFKNVQKSHTLQGVGLLSLYKRAVREDKEPIYVVYFEDADLTATINLTRGK